MNEPIHPSEPCSQRVCMEEFLENMTITLKQTKKTNKVSFTGVHTDKRRILF